MAIVTGRRAKGLESVVLVLDHSADLLVAEPADAMGPEGASAPSLGKLQQRCADQVLIIGWHMEREGRTLHGF